MHRSRTIIGQQVKRMLISMPEQVNKQKASDVCRLGSVIFCCTHRTSFNVPQNKNMCGFTIRNQMQLANWSYYVIRLLIYSKTFFLSKITKQRQPWTHLELAHICMLHICQWSVHCH